MNMAAGAFMLALVITDYVQFWHSYIAVLASGLGWAFDMPSRRSIVLDVTGRGGVTNAMALDSVGMHASRMTGPVLGGALIAMTGIVGGYIAILTLYVVSVIFLSFIKLPPRERPAGAPNILRNLLEASTTCADTASSWLRS